MNSQRHLRRLMPAMPALLLVFALLRLGGSSLEAQQPPTTDCPSSPSYPPNVRVPRPPAPPSTVTVDGNTTTVVTGESLFSKCDPSELCNPWLYPPGTNMMPTIWTNAYDSCGKEMPNTLPSTPDPKVPYNLHDGTPIVTNLVKPGNIAKSPQDDLQQFFTGILYQAQKLNSGGMSASDIATAQKHLQMEIQLAIDILEGNPSFPNSRAYNGLPLLHWDAGSKVKKVIPIKDQNGNVIGGNVDVHQVWYDTHIESDTAYLDVSAVKTVPWTITYKVDVLNRGHDDFSPYAMYFDDPAHSPPGMPPMPNVSMDQSFYNMEDGTDTIFKIKMAPGKYFNLVYTWGWRAHPPRVQIMENGCKTVPFTPPPNPMPADYDCTSNSASLVSWERKVFFKDGQPDKAYALSKISKYAPAMRMWIALNDTKEAQAHKDYAGIIELF